MDSLNLFTNIQNEALRLGFDACGMARPEYLPTQEKYLKNWISRGKHAGLGYLERKMDVRLNPTQILEGARTIIVVLESYYTDAEVSPHSPVLGRYAWLRDYHIRMKERLAQLDQYISQNSTIANYQSRIFVDTAPIMEKVWAQKAGLGWIGKNTLFIHPSLGSWVNIGILICNDPLGNDEQLRSLNREISIPPNGCGNCEACMRSCPGKALEISGELDVARCFSYQSIRSEISSNKQTLIGCDYCQDSCPWNRKAYRKPHPTQAPWDTLHTWTFDEWLHMDQAQYDAKCKETSFYKMGLPYLQSRVEMLKNTIFEAENET